MLQLAIIPTEFLGKELSETGVIALLKCCMIKHTPPCRYFSSTDYVPKIVRSFYLYPRNLTTAEERTCEISHSL